MFLKRLEIRGFKSFADKTELEFPKGITAVVGPNGSGKSNISDAVRWVLGEQSAKSLRGQKMEDVIFAGSDSRKPINYAEVTLVLDNESQTIPIDYTEIAVTRKVYRSGESDYFINNQSCRLKDITELFMDTGLGKEAYSIIGQGRIEEVLSTKSEERRGIFEEAAGIIKYKARKREAEKRLEETEANLVRVYDVMNELEDQIEPLKEASEKAQTYLAYKSDLKYLDISLLAYQIQQIDSEWKQLDEDKSVLDDELANSVAVLNSKEASHTELKWELTKCDQQIDSLQQKFTELSTRLEKALGDEKVLLERKSNNTSLIESLELESKELRLSIEQKTHLYKNKEENYNDLKKQFESKEAELKSEINRLEDYESRLVNQDEQTEALKAEHIEILHQQTSANNQIQHIKQAQEATLKKLSELATQRATIDENLKTVARQITEVTTTITNNEQELLRLKEDVTNTQQSILNQQNVIDDSYQELLNTNQLLESKKGRKKLLLDLEAEFAGYFQGTKEILLAKKRHASQFQGVRGALVDLIKAPKKYEVAIETALGSALQNIVVDNDKHAQACIQYLKEKGKGRATFLPISIIKGQAKRYRNVEQVEGFVGYANELINVAQDYRSIIDSLLGNVLIAKDIKTATNIARLVDYRGRIVTLEGDFISPGGSMTGGSQQKKTSSLMSRKNEITSLEKEINDLQNVVNSKSVEHNKHKSGLESLQAQIQQQKAILDQTQNKAIELASKLQKLEQELSYRNENLQMIEQEQHHYNNEQEKYNLTQLEQEQRLVKLKNEQQQIEGQLNTHQQQLNEQRAQQHTTSSKVTDYKIELTKYQEQLKTLDEIRARDITEIQELEKRLQKLTDDILARNNQQQEIDTTVNSLKETIELDNEQKANMQRQIDLERVSRQRMQEQLTKQEATIADLTKKTKELEKQIHQIEVKTNRFDVELNNALNQLQEEYEISFERAINEFPLTEDPNVIKTKVKELKRKIVALGEVNTGAIEEYQRVDERYHFLKHQREDLLEAISKLNHVIKEMNVEMEKRFLDSFNLIKDSFSKVFQQMFGGGRASLKLADPENVLTTGIEIFAEPPGKKLQHLSLLSGGERALTAIALLFAILRVSPVPFCILDEVEAALDEANVTRFANYLRKFCDQTQFIVVTHRKGTMESADVLYGVTMEGSGVSKMVSVKLEDVIDLDIEREAIEAS
ncbi:chromosome segregation protein SMC [Desulfuribacillus alkaliarsenatis]|uniref:Chromosome partition protein Smc n=1 Tax=Desulfuribacillus alkaliarsenatis TaxID=766136 RepID=A0A1E5G646_9FIRM|nr:chromosome segregation protein SMC [Desulfuribacillus alkaliarsenatis]OEF98565.1 chromosome segregation protein SMC [Desulfuribacillus alkaliarsenatis]